MSEEQRTDFEAGYVEQFGRLPQNWDHEIRRYRDAHAQGAWWGWQASRAALEIDLPFPASVSMGLSLPEVAAYSEALDNCREAIEAAGVRVKP